MEMRKMMKVRDSGNSRIETRNRSRGHHIEKSSLRMRSVKAISGTCVPFEGSDLVRGCTHCDCSLPLAAYVHDDDGGVRK